VCFTTGAMRVEPDRRHLTLPVIGTVRTHENMRRIERLIRGGRARVLAISVRRNGTRIDACVRVLVQRPIQPKVALPDSRVGIDVGVRRLATVADERGEVLERSPTQRRWARRSKSFGTPAVPARAARKVHDATVSAPPRFPGCIAGSTMSALITCTS
jgi:putative transposase